MPLNVIRLAVTRLLEDDLVGPRLTVVWHAGEPLVLPPAYYEKAFDSVDGLCGDTCEVTHSIQTNGILIDESWCDLFRRSDVRLGISLDGPATIHDLHRKTRKGKGTHANVMRGIQILRRHGIPFHVIAVATADSLDQAVAIKSFFTEHGIQDVGFNFDESEGKYARSSLIGHESRHKAFIDDTLELALASGGRYRVRELTQAFRLVTEGLPEYHFDRKKFPKNDQTMPFALISVAWNGDFSTFSPELLGQQCPEFDNFMLGNVGDGGYLASSQRDNFVEMWRQVNTGVSACRRTCAYFSYCGGGAPANKFYENGSLASTETLYCRAMTQRPFDAVLGKLESDLGLNMLSN